MSAFYKMRYDLSATVGPYYVGNNSLVGDYRVSFYGAAEAGSGSYDITFSWEDDYGIRTSAIITVNAGDFAEKTFTIHSTAKTQDGHLYHNIVMNASPGTLHGWISVEAIDCPTIQQGP